MKEFKVRSSKVKEDGKEGDKSGIPPLNLSLNIVIRELVSEIMEVPDSANFFLCSRSISAWSFLIPLNARNPSIQLGITITNK